MLSEIEYKRLVWHSRRGMLELDLLLLPFAQECVPTLDGERQLSYQRLLAEEDQDLFSWLVDRSVHPDPALQRIIEEIRAFAASRA